MSVKRRKTKLVFYLGGPQAVKGWNYWRTSIKSGAIFGSQIVAGAGIKMSRYTYCHAIPKLSATSHFCYRHKKMEGLNTTAILPLEVDE